MNRLLRRLVLGFIILCAFYQPAIAQSPPNTITFDNQSGEFAMVKVVGPTKVAVEVPNNQEQTVNVEAGDYYLLVRYGTSPEEYKYTKGDPFEVTQSGRQYSIITITLHKVLDGNYKTEPVSGEEFEKASVSNPSESIPHSSSAASPTYSAQTYTRLERDGQVEPSNRRFPEDE